MRRALPASALALVMSTAGAAAAMASCDERNMWAEFHSDPATGAGIGLARNLTGGLWGDLRMDGLGTNGATANLDAIYVVPQKFLWMEVYGGLGVDYALGTPRLGGHVIAGSQFWCFFTEDEYQLVNRRNVVRAGVRIRF